MLFDFRVYIIIGVFITVGIALMLFNFIFIYYGQEQTTPFKRKIKRWRNVLYKQMNLVYSKKSVKNRHYKLLLEKLRNPSELVAYSKALIYFKLEFLSAYIGYIHNEYDTFLKLAHIYSKKQNIEKACFADFICNFPEATAGSSKQIVAVLTSYIEGSSLHCRANVLRAICSMGDAPGVVNVLRAVSEKSLFIHNHLLTNILSNFSGSKEGLGRRLWNEGQDWDNNIKVSVIQFISKYSGDYRHEFMPILQNPSTDVEVRTAIIHYYGKYQYDPVRSTLLDLIPNPESINLATKSTSALVLYPETDTVNALKAALYDPNWNIRYNASSSLVQLSEQVDLQKILQNETANAKEIVTYMLEREAKFKTRSAARSYKGYRHNFASELKAAGYRHDTDSDLKIGAVLKV